MHLLTFFILISLHTNSFMNAGTDGHVEQARLTCPLQDSQHFRAVVNSKTFRPDEYWAHGGGGVISIQASDMDEAGFQFMLPDKIAVGSHELSYDTADTIQCLYDSGEDSGEPKSGTLRITLHDRQTKRIEGSFSFKGEFSEGGAFSVSDGSFALSYE